MKAQAWDELCDAIHAPKPPLQEVSLQLRSHFCWASPYPILLPNNKSFEWETTSDSLSKKLDLREQVHTLKATHVHAWTHEGEYIYMHVCMNVHSMTVGWWVRPTTLFLPLPWPGGDHSSWGNILKVERRWVAVDTGVRSDLFCPTASHSRHWEGLRCILS